MKTHIQSIPGIVLIEPKRFEDNRGWFSETWNATRMAEIGIEENFVQDNHSYSRKAGTIRGLHCQVGQYAQGKLVSCVKGQIWDVAVDIRAGSPTFGKYVAAILSACNGHQLWIPPGFLHGFCTMENDCEVIYKVTSQYHKESERGVIWNDSEIGLPWPIEPENAVISEKDMSMPKLAEIKKEMSELFIY